MGTRLQKVRSLLQGRRVKLVLLALVVGGVGFGYYLYRERTIDRHREEAESALEGLDFPTAISQLDDYLAARPESADVHFLLGRTLRRKGEFEQATQHLSEAKRLGWDADAIGREMLLIDLQRTGMRERPGNELASLVQGPDPDRVMLETLYRGDLAIKNWDRAGLWLHLWLESYPDDWQPRLWQAELLEQFKKYDRARADYLRVLELRSNQRRAILGVGMCALVNRADLDEAEDYLSRYLVLDPDHAEAQIGLARCRFLRGDLTGGRERASTVLGINPHHAEAALLLGTIETEAGNNEEALRWLRVAEAEGADPSGVYYQLAQVLQRMGRTAEAEKALRRFTDRRNLLQALEAAKRYAEQQPRNADLQFEVGRLYVALNRPEFAEHWFTLALKQDPNHRASHSALADYYSLHPDPGVAARAQFHRIRAQSAGPKKTGP